MRLGPRQEDRVLSSKNHLRPLDTLVGTLVGILDTREGVKKGINSFSMFNGCTTLSIYMWCNDIFEFFFFSTSVASDNSTTAQERFSSSKSISSDQFFNRRHESSVDVSNPPITIITYCNTDILSHS